MNDFFSGLWFWWKGWAHLVRHRSLLAAAILPLIISVASAFALLWVMAHYLPGWAHALVGMIVGVATGFLYDLLYYPLVVGGGILLFIACLYVIYFLQALIAIPFYSALAERTLIQSGKKRSEPMVFKLWLRQTLRMLRVSVIKTLLFLLIGVGLFVFSFFPILNLLALGATLLLLAYDCLDFSFDALGYGFRQRLGYVFRNRLQWAGMAAGLALTLIIPGLTLLVIPGAIVGSALILKDQNDSRTASPPNL